MKKPRFRISSLLWLVALIATFLAARSPVFDFVFDPANRQSTIKLKGWSQLTSRSEPDVLDLKMTDATTCVLLPKKPGLCLVEIKTTAGIEAYLVRVTNMKNVHVQPTDINSRVTKVLEGGKTVTDVLDEAFGPPIDVDDRSTDLETTEQ